MAKAKEIIDLDCGANARQWVAPVLKLRLAETINLREAALDFADIEGVHDMRVASRRLRGGLRDFAALLRKKFLRRSAREIKKLADALGAVRDADVAVAALEKLRTAASAENIKNGIAVFIKEISEKRETARTDLIKSLTETDLTRLQTDFAAALDSAVKPRRKDFEISFDSAGRAAVSDGLENFVRLGAALYEPFESEGLHDLRIAAKRLRYALELFAACWGARIKFFAEQISVMQSALGEVHDADVWIEDLSVKLKKDNLAPDEFAAGVWLLEKFVKTRTAHYRAALKLWSDWQSDDFVKKMRAVINQE